ncbi:MAG: glycosyltransferase family 2 protein [Planctomycetes bacterium]|nr:glycosyltransferase family 2 protein [Planctomycetota bacterium]
MHDIDISIVIPLYNEDESVGHLYNAVTKVMSGLQTEYEIIFVDDGSSDSTFLQAKTMHKSDPRLKVIKFRKNYGQTPAMQAGFDHAEGRIIISMDGDLQNDPRDIPRFLEKIDEGYDIVCGWRKNRKDKLVTRKIPSKIANWLMGMISGIKIHDNGCSLKAYRNVAIKKTRLYSDMHRFIPAMTSIIGARYGEIVVTHHARKFGSSKYGLSRIWKVFLDMFTMKMLVSFSSAHGVWFAILGIPFLVMGALFALISINLYLKMSEFASFPIIVPSISLLFFFLSAHMLLVGFLTEMIQKTGDTKKKGVRGISSIEV